ncbi:B12-binding domain-containing radical SAM protein [Candidatus Margulisiibacteriota bacterium]
MKILLLFPKWSGEYGLFGYFAKKGSTWPPLNLAYLAAIAEKQGHQVKIIDGQAEDLSAEAIIRQAEEFNPDLIGMTATTPFFHVVNDLARQLKEKLNKPIIIGGHHITVLKEQAFSPWFDYAFIGEAEDSWSSFLERYQNNDDLSGVKGLLYREGDEFEFTGEAQPILDLDQLPLPARHLLKPQLYKMGTLKGTKKFTTIMTVRGCPFECIFCSTDVFGRKVRKRSPELVIKEIKQIIKEQGIRHYVFLDDTLTLDRRHILRICDLIIEEELNITFEGSTRADLVDEELVSRLAKAGMIRISFGLETVDENIRKIMKKNVPLESYHLANKLTNKYGIETLNSCMIGLPGETRETVEKTLAYLRKSKEIKQANMSIAVPYPGTKLYEMAKRGENGLKLVSEDFSNFRRYNAAVMQVGDLSREDLIRLQNRAYVEIYSAPWRIMPMLRKSGVIGGLLTISRLFKYLAHKYRAKGAKI